MPESNIIICRCPKNDGFSNLLSMPADSYQSAQFHMDFNKIGSVQEIVDRLLWMESRGYHLKNDRGWVYRSENVANVVSELYDVSIEIGEIVGFNFRYLTRSGNLRGRVIELIEEDLDKLKHEDEDDGSMDQSNS